MARFIVSVPDPLFASITPAQNPPQRNPEPVSQATQGIAVGDVSLSGNVLPLSTLCRQVEFQAVPNAFEDFRKDHAKETSCRSK